MRRLGRFKLSVEFLDHLTERDKALFFRGMQVIDTMDIENNQVVEFKALHPEFKFIDEYEYIPEYVARFTNGCKSPFWEEVV